MFWYSGFFWWNILFVFRLPCRKTRFEKTQESPCSQVESLTKLLNKTLLIHFCKFLWKMKNVLKSWTFSLRLYFVDKNFLWHSNQIILRCDLRHSKIYSAVNCISSECWFVWWRLSLNWDCVFAISAASLFPGSILKLKVSCTKTYLT